MVVLNLFSFFNYILTQFLKNLFFYYFNWFWYQLIYYDDFKVLLIIPLFKIFWYYLLLVWHVIGILTYIIINFNWFNSQLVWAHSWIKYGNTRSNTLTECVNLFGIDIICYALIKNPFLFNIIIFLRIHQTLSLRQIKVLWLV
jgi:hypothetical protein